MLNDYKDLIMDTLLDEYDKVTCIEDDHFKGYLKELDETHEISVIAVYDENEDLKGFEVNGENLDNGHNWEIMYLPAGKGL